MHDDDLLAVRRIGLRIKALEAQLAASNGNDAADLEAIRAELAELEVTVSAHAEAIEALQKRPQVIVAGGGGGAGPPAGASWASGCPSAADVLVLPVLARRCVVITDNELRETLATVAAALQRVEAASATPPPWFKSVMSLIVSGVGAEMRHQISGAVRKSEGHTLDDIEGLSRRIALVEAELRSARK